MHLQYISGYLKCIVTTIFWFTTKMCFVLFLGCVHGVGTTRQIHQVSLIPVYMGQPCRQAQMATNDFGTSSHNVVSHSVVNPERILLPLLHMKLGLIKKIL